MGLESPYTHGATLRAGQRAITLRVNGIPKAPSQLRENWANSLSIPVAGSGVDESKNGTGNFPKCGQIHFRHHVLPLLKACLCGIDGLRAIVGGMEVVGVREGLSDALCEARA